MASELRVDTLKDSSGNNSVGMSYVAEGSAKAWSVFDGSGTAAIGDSFAVTSLTDEGTGSYTTTFTNAFNTSDYALPTSTRNNHMIGRYSNTTTTFRLENRVNGGTETDTPYVALSAVGDLA